MEDARALNGPAERAPNDAGIAGMNWDQLQAAGLDGQRAQCEAGCQSRASYMSTVSCSDLSLVSNSHWLKTTTELLP